MSVRVLLAVKEIHGFSNWTWIYLHGHGHINHGFHEFIYHGFIYHKHNLRNCFPLFYYLYGEKL